MADDTHVLIADDHPLVRRALAEAIVETLPASVRVTEAGTFAETSDALRTGSIDLLLLDLSMPGMSGFTGLASLRATFPVVPVVVVSANEEPAAMRQSMELGVSGYVPKSTPLPVIGEAVETVLGGGVWFPEAAEAGRAELSHRDLAARMAELTPQQLRVLLLLTHGKLNKQIAYEMALTEATVKAHLSQIFRKLGVQSRTQAVIAARHLGVDEPPATDAAGRAPS
jgi:DNA-binding NarL/FixJ family response regulator